MASITLAGLMQDLFGDQIQDLEDSTYELLERLDIDAMEGQQLINLANLVGQEILSTDDTTLRTFIKGKVAQNTSRGNFADVYNIFKILSGTSDFVIRELYPAAIEITVGFGVLASGLEQDILNFMRDSVGAGIAVDSIKKEPQDGDLVMVQSGDTTYTGNQMGVGIMRGPIAI